jgi:TolB-like protein/Flp pilus assembly protein TadD
LSFFNELNRRNVTRVAVAYAVAGWVITEVASVVLSAFTAPEWVLQVLIVLLAIGFPLALIFSWVYELTPEGLKKESEIGSEPSVSGHTAKKLNLVVIVLLVIAIGLVLFDRLTPRSPGQLAALSRSAAPAQPAPGAAPSLAVLAFENMSTDAENEFFADGISEEILNLLADVSGMSVASRTSAFAFKGKDLPIPEIAQALKVRYVLEGSVRKAGEQVRVTAQLIDAETDRHLWSDTYDRALRDIFTIQDEIANAIGRALQVRLLGKEGSEIKAEAIDPDVYTRFLEARYLLRRRNAVDIEEGNRLLIDVVAAEPRFARAHILLGEAYLLNNSEQAALVERRIARALANMHASLARSLDPGLGGIDMIMGSIAGENQNTLAALEYYEQAISLEPGEPRPYHWRGVLYNSLGYRDRCIQDMEKALELDPQNPNVHYAFASCLLMGAGDFDRAAELAGRGPTLGNPGGYILTVLAEELRGDRAAALDHLIRYIEEFNGQDESRDETLAPLLALWQGGGASEPETWELSNRANPISLFLWGDSEAILQQVGQEGFQLGVIRVLWADHYSELRRDQRFIAALEAAGAFEVWRELGPPPGCRESGESFIC